MTFSPEVPMMIPKQIAVTVVTALALSGCGVGPFLFTAVTIATGGGGGGRGSGKGTMVQIVLSQTVASMQTQDLARLPFARTVRIPADAAFNVSGVIDQSQGSISADRVKFVLAHLRQQQYLRCLAVTLDVHAHVMPPKKAPSVGSLTVPCAGGQEKPLPVEPGDIVFSPGDTLAVWLQPEDGDLPAGSRLTLNVEDFVFEIEPDKQQGRYRHVQGLSLRNSIW
jgi:hypothetical protein